MVLAIWQRAESYFRPIQFLAVAIYGAILVLFEILTLQGTNDVLNRDKLGDRIFSKVWLRMDSAIKAFEEDSEVPALDATAYGTVLEIGPGSGNQLSRYNKSAITKIYGVEPNRDLHAALRQTIKDTGLSDIYEIVPCGVEDFDKLREYGVLEGSIDTLMSVQVLCSVPRPEVMVKAMYRLLKPGGQMIVFEHVKSEDWLSGWMQRIYGTVWPFFMGNCHLDRPTGEYLLAAGKWETLEVKGPQAEDAPLVFPRVRGRLIKPSGVN